MLKIKLGAKDFYRVLWLPNSQDKLSTITSWHNVYVYAFPLNNCTHKTKKRFTSLGGEFKDRSRELLLTFQINLNQIL